MVLSPTSFLALIATCTSFVSGRGSFSYSDPKNWPGLCKTGKEQSPVDLNQNQNTLNKVVYVDPKKQNANTHVRWARPLITDFKDVSLGMNHGVLTCKVSSPDMSLQGSNKKQPSKYELQAADRSYQLSGFQFHTPSEHSINGKHEDLEVQFTHKDPDGNIAMVGVLFKSFSEHGPTDSFFLEIKNSMPSKNTDEKPRNIMTVSLPESFTTLFSESPFYQYQGSLTSPPCTEKVTWTVYSEIVGLNEKLFKSIKKLLINNARPIQRTSPGTENAANNNGGNTKRRTSVNPSLSKKGNSP